MQDTDFATITDFLFKVQTECKKEKKQENNPF